uniref:Major capsid protein N-terminal domain-containing protein n=1 Tax=viral metagenome TaxID=1070528 RepID=A0A6C0E8F4_9ZZZZ
MSGGLMQLVAYGAQDIYLTGNAQITFFKVVYRRHTNFSIESIEQTFEGDVDFGKKVTVTIARNGDLVTKAMLRVVLPALNQSQNSSTWHGWVNSIGNALIKSVEVEIGGQMIDKHYGEWLEIFGELSYDDASMRVYRSLIGKYESDISLETNALTSKTLYVPLQFWFCRNPGLALPLIALQYHEVKMHFDLRPLRELTRSNVVITNPQDTSGATARIMSASLWLDYIYLDTDERRRFAQVSHEYLIEQVQCNGTEGIKANTSSLNCRLDFNHPCKELLWVINRDTLRTANTSTGNNWFNFSSSTGGDTINEAKLLFNGHDRMRARDALYFREVQPFHHHSRAPSKHIYNYSFALKPEEHQPSGTCNMSRLDNVVLNLDFNGVSVVDSKLTVFAPNYNILRIMSGMGGLAYSN